MFSSFLHLLFLKIRNDAFLFKKERIKSIFSIFILFFYFCNLKNTKRKMKIVNKRTRWNIKKWKWKEEGEGEEESPFIRIVIRTRSIRFVYFVFWEVWMSVRPVFFSLRHSFSSVSFRLKFLCIVGLFFFWPRDELQSSWWMARQPSWWTISQSLNAIWVGVLNVYYEMKQNIKGVYIHTYVRSTLHTACNIQYV